MLITIEGLIGAGKTTLTNTLASASGCAPFLEPVETNPFLCDYYKNPGRWAYAMQTHLLFERFKAFQEAHYRSLRGETCILDRSYYGDYAFAIVQHEDGFFTEKEFSSYERMHEALQPQLVYPDVLIWLELSPEETMERIKKRARGCESGIPLEYLQHLYDAYQTVLTALESRCKVVRIDARPDALSVLSQVTGVIEDTRKILSTSGHPCYK